MEKEKVIKFSCAYCDEVFTLSKKQVDAVEKIAVIKCPNCNDTEHVVEIAVTKKPKEVKRIDVTNHDFPLEVTCPNCERQITLYFNGGELDYGVCCGLRYELEHTRIDLIVKKMGG